MLIFVTKRHRPDVQHWTGRRWLGVADALFWPVAFVSALRAVAMPMGAAGTVLTALALLMAVERVYRAWWVNERYWFATWALGRVLVWVGLLGVLLKLAVSLSGRS